MNITLNSEQSKLLDALSRQGGYVSIEDAVDMALILLGETVMSPQTEVDPEYLAWVEQTQLKIEEGFQAAAQGELLEITEILNQLHNKVEKARAA